MIANASFAWRRTSVLRLSIGSTFPVVVDCCSDVISSFTFATVGDVLNCSVTLTKTSSWAERRGEILVTWLVIRWDKLRSDIVESSEQDDRLNMSKDLSSVMSTDNLHQRLFSETTTFHNVSIDHLEGQSENDNEWIKRGMYECISMVRTPAEILFALVHVDGNGIFRLP